MVAIAKRPSAAWAFTAAVRDEVLDAARAKDVATKFDDRVADIGVADGANGDFLWRESVAVSKKWHGGGEATYPPVSGR